jgi:hypothetical protein
MAAGINGNGGRARRGLSLDGWAVILAFVLAFAVRFGLLGNVPW